MTSGSGNCPLGPVPALVVVAFSHAARLSARTGVTGWLTGLVLCPA
ncbi:MAG TPA: hypothetical protein VHZ03_57140 [Trebonia sp.]|jgi:hypothetical protein|nr:hypothetical protein [Trebonia sp.]